MKKTKVSLEDAQALTAFFRAFSNEFKYPESYLREIEFCLKGVTGLESTVTDFEKKIEASKLDSHYGKLWEFFYPLARILNSDRFQKWKEQEYQKK